MKKIIPVLLLFTACMTNSNKVDEAPYSKIKTLTLSYNIMYCTCAQWSESKFDKNPKKKIMYWLEPENTLLVNADTLYNGELPLQIQVTGEIANENGYPVGANVEKLRLDEKAKLFIYTKIKVLKNGKKKKDK